MTKSPTETSPQVYARVAGFLYLLPFAAFSLVYVPSRLIVPGDTAATARTIMANASLFRLGIVSDLIGQIVFIVVALVLYQVLKPVNKNMARLMVIFWLVGVPIDMLNNLNQLALLGLPHEASHSTGFTADQMNTLVSLFLNLHDNGVSIAEIFWGLWLLPMGYLVFKSGFLPRMLGVLLIIASVGYVIQSFVDLLFPDSGVTLYLFTSWGELLFVWWLVIKGVNVERWEQCARASA